MTTKHTPGKLEFAENPYEPNKFSIGCDGKWLMAIQHNGEPWVEVQRANMRRLVACWNACDGIDTDLLEGFSPRFLATYPDRVLAERRALEAQRKDLLLALDACKQAMAAAIEAMPINEEAAALCEQADGIADSAIACVTGVAAC